MPKPVRPLRGARRPLAAVTLAALGAAAPASVAVLGAPLALAVLGPAQPAAAAAPVTAVSPVTAVPAVPAVAADAPPGPEAVAEPSAVAPGGTVSLEITGCGTRTGTVSSDAFGEIHLQPADLRATQLFGSATVRTYAEPGSHQVRFRCGGPDGRVATTRLAVSADGVEAAGNDTFAGLSATTGTAAGGVLLAAGAGAAAYALRRRSRATPDA